MTRNEKRFGVIGTIGNGSELLPIPRKEPHTSYHVIDTVTREELAIRYSMAHAKLAMENAGGATSVVFRPIFREIPDDVYS